MVKLDTRNFKPIQVEIDGNVYEVKKITNRVLLKADEISKRLETPGIGPNEMVHIVAEFLSYFLPMDADWFIDNLTLDECRLLMDGITAEMTKAMGGSEPPLATGPGGDNSPK